MSNLSQIKHDKLAPTYGVINNKDLERHHVRSLITVPPSDAIKQLDDLWHIYWDQEGIAAGSFNDRATLWLVDELTSGGDLVEPEWNADSAIAAGVGYTDLGAGAYRFTKTSADGGDAGVHSRIGHQTGKWYGEMRVTPWTWIERMGFVHRATPETALSRWHTVGTHDYSWGWDMLGERGIFHNSIKIVSGMPVSNSGWRVMIALDLDNQKAWWGHNGGWVLSGNPSTGANPQVTGFPVDGTITYYLGAWGYYQNVQSLCFFNGTRNPPVHTIPTGFTVWQDNYITPATPPDEDDLPGLWWEYWNTL